VNDEPDIRQRILEAALRLFAHQGYGSTSVREVVEAAGVTKPTLYYYFDGKEALFREVIAAKLEEGEALVAAALSQEGSVVEKLRTAFRGTLHAAHADPDGLRLMLTCSLPGSHGQPEVDVIERHMRNMAPLEALVSAGIASGEFRSDVDPHIAVVSLLGAINLQVVGILRGMEVEVDVVDRLLDTWLHGVAP
jgi:AcrR family transcriptional regulator